jgi:hypothetical protein
MATFLRSYTLKRLIHDQNWFVQVAVSFASASEDATRVPTDRRFDDLPAP